MKKLEPRDHSASRMVDLYVLGSMIYDHQSSLLVAKARLENWDRQEQPQLEVAADPTRNDLKTPQEACC